MTGRHQGQMSLSRLRPVATLAVAWRTLLLVAIGAIAGLLANRLHPKGVRVTFYQPPTMCSSTYAEAERIEVLSPKTAAGLCGQPNALVADVRDAESFAKGHIAGAVHIPCSGSVADVDRVRERLAGKTRLVVYGETEDQGHKVALDLLRRLGRSDLAISVISGGWSAWFDEGLACSSGPCDDCEEGTSHANHSGT